MTFAQIKQAAVDAQAICNKARMEAGNNSVAVFKLASIQRNILHSLRSQV